MGSASERIIEPFYTRKEPIKASHRAIATVGTLSARNKHRGNRVLTLDP
jgi:hypothetical protein